MNVNFMYNQPKRVRRSSSGDNSSEEELGEYTGNAVPRPGKKTRGRVKVKMELIKSKLRRYTTFSKRKTGIMKKAYELATLTGTQVMVLVASETGHVYTFATQKLQPMITSDAGKALIQTCLNSPDPPAAGIDSRMTETGYEEVDLSYNVNEEDSSQSTINADDPDESLAASNSQVSSRDPSPAQSMSGSEPPDPPLMTIPPLVMTELLKSVQQEKNSEVAETEHARRLELLQKLREQELKAATVISHVRQNNPSEEPNNIFRPIEPERTRTSITDERANRLVQGYRSIAPQPVRVTSAQLPIAITSDMQSVPQNLILPRKR